jgi:ribonuclease HI
MNPGMPHFVLFAETGLSLVSGNNSLDDDRASMVFASGSNQHLPFAQSKGAWRFVLRSVDGAKYFEAADVETDVIGERLELLTLVRALESLDQPSQVTLMGSSNYLRQGIQFGMPEWRTNDWLWEWFGQMVPVKNADLWQRLDRLMAFHQVECRIRRTDAAHPALPMPNYATPRDVPTNAILAVAKAWSVRTWDWMPMGVRKRIRAYEGKLRQIATASIKAVLTLRNQYEQIRRKMQNSSIPGSV